MSAYEVLAPAVTGSQGLTDVGTVTTNVHVIEAKEDSRTQAVVTLSDATLHEADGALGEESTLHDGLDKVAETGIATLLGEHFLPTIEGGQVVTVAGVVDRLEQPQKGDLDNGLGVPVEVVAGAGEFVVVRFHDLILRDDLADCNSVSHAETHPRG